MFDRRSFILSMAALAAFPIGSPRAADKKRVGALFAGRIDDNGFMQSGYTALEQARTQLGVNVEFTQGIKPEKELLAEALRQLASKNPDIVVAHGGQNNAAAQQVATEFPSVAFVVTQGAVTGPNLSSYEVLQEQSAFLAGVLAALMTKTGVVGHMSGIRVTPGLKGRAGFIDGVRHANPDIKVLTNFSGNQDDNALSYKVASAMMAEKADIVFTMLNAGRTGVTDACREKRTLQIGNVIDWTKIAPDVFVASAVANAGLGLFNAAADLTTGKFQLNVTKKIGLEQPDAVRLAVGPSVPEAIIAKIGDLSKAIVAGSIDVKTQYDGPEFPTPA